MTKELFTLAPTAQGTATRITCQCGASADYFMAKSGVSPEALPRIFAQRGWRVGRNAQRHKCPACLATKHHTQSPEPAPMLKEPLQVEIVPQPGASDLPPRVMSREDGQIVFAKLTECYLGEATGYAKGWHDQAVATDLNCPRKWVEDIREQFFGPVKADQSPEVIELTSRLDALDALRAKLIECVDDASSVAHDAMAYVERAKPDLARYIKDAEAIRADLRKLTGRAS